MGDAATQPQSLEAQVALLTERLTKFTMIISKQQERIVKLEELTNDFTPPDPEKALLDRFASSSRTNRAVNAPPENIALTLHLQNVRQIPAVHIVNSGLITQSRMQGLQKWSIQHTLDFCDINGVRHIYEGGLGIDGMWDLIPNPDLIRQALEHKP